jgi:hypothetical protein
MSPMDLAFGRCYQHQGIGDRPLARLVSFVLVHVP